MTCGVGFLEDNDFCLVDWTGLGLLRLGKAIIFSGFRKILLFLRDKPQMDKS